MSVRVTPVILIIIEICNYREFDQINLEQVELY